MTVGGDRVTVRALNGGKRAGAVTAQHTSVWQQRHGMGALGRAFLGRVSVRASCRMGRRCCGVGCVGWRVIVARAMCG